MKIPPYIPLAKCVLALGCAILSLSSTRATEWTVPGDFATIQEANDAPAVLNGDRVLVGPGEHAGATLNKSIEIRGTGGAVITSGPVHSSGFIQGFRLLAGSAGATVSHLQFTVAFPVMSRDAVNDVTVSHCQMENPVQGITNWGGSGWDISHNAIHGLRTRNGGGIAIFVGDFSGGIVKDNIVTHNTIDGTVHVDPIDQGGYNASGIVLYADFRWNRDGAANIVYNRIIKNKVSLVSDTPAVVDVAAIELTDTMDDNNLGPILFDNAVGFNDLRGTTLQIVLTPSGLESANDISRNLGDNRGHGLHPSVFGPGVD